MSQEKKSKKSSFSMFRMLFGNRNKQLSFLEEEQLQSPMKTVVKNFVANKVAMCALVTFLIIFLGVIIYPMFVKLDLSYQEQTQQNVSPGLNMMKIPNKLKGNIKQISVGSTFSVGVSNDGEVFIWGKTKVTSIIDLKDIPKDMGKVVQVAAGVDHVLALNDEGKLFAWGNSRNKQCAIPDTLAGVTNIKQITSGLQSSAVVTEDGNVYFWGNTGVIDFNIKEYQGQIAKVLINSSGVLGLTKDGQVVSLTTNDLGFSNIPENMGKIVDIGLTAQTAAAVNENGEVFVWGNVSDNIDKVPATDSKVVALSSGRFHYTALLEDGGVISWGQDIYNESSYPTNLSNVTNIYSGYYQNYAVTDSGKATTWGLKGYILGTDGYGRDVLSRIMEGGRMTMLIGAIAVIIALTIAIIIGGISGFFGGKVDMILMRITEIVAALPFLPFAMTLSAIIGNKLNETQRIALIMVILGLLTRTGDARLIRAQVLAERNKEFVTAAKAVGVRQKSIIFRHIIPNVISVIIVSATLSFAGAMLTESGLSFLGFGVKEPSPTWGNMLNGCQSSTVILQYWWRWVFPSIALGLATVSINLIGDGLRDAIDPKANER
ncbi:MAG TPA: ABC transporter permease subunit [Lachnospiraceae bacterium]|nr:ABC transporter permease subunit [Lachnospiraceae bacterium]